MTKKDSGRTKPSRGSRFSLRNILNSTNLLAGASNVNLPLPTQSGRAKEPFSSKNRRRGSESESSEFNGGGSDSSDIFAVDCYIEPQLLADGMYECPLCYGAVASFPEVESCQSHKACSDCWKSYLKIQITESRVNLTCFQCSKPLHPNDIKVLAEPELMTKYEDFMLRRVISREPDARWCPAPDCGFAVIAEGCASCPRLLCERPGCVTGSSGQTCFCYHCKSLWHPNLTCDAARALRSTDNMESFLTATGLSKLISENQAGIREDIKPCPRCQVLIVKCDDGSCNHMSCAVCGAEFCWLCMKQVSDLHYLSPSGCTFWGKKPWSRKKKLMWQLGTLIGAPVGIGLVAGIAVPAMIIGIPVWVGRKIHNKMKNSARHRRNLAVGSGVLAAIIVSPILAGLAVGLGVPILLAYVYGVVPISLCRGGGCSDFGQLQNPDEIDLEDGEPTTVITHHGLTRQSTRSNDFGSARGGAPSIGEVSVVSSNGGNHQRSASPDRESASIKGLTGSVGSNPPSHKLEIQADVITNNKRHSLTSEASCCQESETGSTRGLAGSLLSYKVNIEDAKSETSCR